MSTGQVTPKRSIIHEALRARNQPDSTIKVVTAANHTYRMRSRLIRQLIKQMVHDVTREALQAPSYAQYI
eukprot:7148397-Pyramimonas_sp.AAC.1